MVYPKLNLPEYEIRIEDDKIWDPLRKKYLKLTPEEWVRQHFIQYLIQDKQYPAGRIVSEHTVDYSGQKKRCDIAIYSEALDVDMIVECKAPKVELTEDTFYQVAKYTKVLQASLLILTNGIQHYCAFMDKQKKEIKFLKKIPSHDELREMLA